MKMKMKMKMKPDHTSGVTATLSATVPVVGISVLQL
jgi:hypothetical protein